MAFYRILRHATSGRLFVVARRTTQVPGRVAIRDWVKMPVDNDGYPLWFEPQFSVNCPDLTTRRQVEDYLLCLEDGNLNVLHRKVQL